MVNSVDERFSRFCEVKIHLLMSHVDKEVVNYNHMEEVNSKLQWSTIKADLSLMKLISSSFLLQFRLF